VALHPGILHERQGAQGSWGRTVVQA